VFPAHKNLKKASQHLPPAGGKNSNDFSLCVEAGSYPARYTDFPAYP